MADPLHDALVQATLATLLGATDVPYQQTDLNGHPIFQGTISIKSAFESRLREHVHAGKMDALIAKALDMIKPEDLVEAIKAEMIKRFLAGLEPVRGDSWSNTPATPGWLSAKAREIAVEATKTALASDEQLLDTLRARIGAEVDRNRVHLTVQLSDPEAATT
jgi:hypothetical protein